MMTYRSLIISAALAMVVVVAGLAGAGSVPVLASGSAAGALGDYLSTKPGPGRFPLVADGQAAPLVVDAADYPGAVRVVGDLRADIGRVTGVTPRVAVGAMPRATARVMLVGTIGHSALIDGLIDQWKLDVRGIAGQWETSLEQVVSHPMSGVDSAFVVAGSDQRGTIYGKIARYPATLDGGGDPMLVAGWINETTTIKKAALARLGLTEAPPQRTSEQQIAAIVDASVGYSACSRRQISTTAQRSTRGSA